MVHADQDGFFDAHVIGKLQCQICNCGAFPDLSTHIATETGTGVRCINESG